MPEHRPRADFYILPVSRKPLLFACQLVEKIWGQGYQVHLHAASEAQAADLDRLLWVFRPTSFVPHLKLSADDAADPSPAVTIGWGERCPQHRQVLLNLSPTAPPFVESFERIAEIVSGDESERRAARQRYRAYQQAGMELHNQTIPDHDHR